jgi:hypothetical protein
MGQIYLISEGLTREASQRFRMYGTFCNPVNTYGDALLSTENFTISYNIKKARPMTV